jgi:hypothetical protein
MQVIFSVFSIKIPENSPVNTVLGTLSIVDEDKNSKHQCEILNLIDVPFKVVPLSGLSER